jgi:hypothetical protein
MGIRSKSYYPLSFVLAFLFSSTLTVPAQAQPFSHEGIKPLNYPRLAVDRAQLVEDRYSRKGPDLERFHTPLMLKPPVEGFDFVDNGLQTGFVFIPPDPIVSVGADHVLNLGNVLIEWRDKADPTMGLHQESLVDFFSALPGPPPGPGTTLGTFTFDPKCIYDQYAGRFVVIALEVWDIFAGDPSDQSRILLAVSKTGDPNDGWWFHAIDSKIVIGVSQTFADYPGIAIDDKAVYVTVNHFNFFSQPAVGATRLWIIDKSPFYGGPNQSAVVTVHDPYASAGLATTTQPAHMYGTPPTGMGTYLVSYSGLTSGGNEVVQVVQVTDPLGASGGPNFSQQFIAVGNIDNTVFALPDAPQADTTTTIEVNDRRALNAVWRDNSLYMSATILPTVGPDASQTTAHWWEINTSGGPGSWTLTQQANVGAEDLGPATYTFFPAIMVDGLGNVGVGFSASNALIYCGAYYAAQQVPDAPGTMQNTRALALGTDPYTRTFGQGRNRWGDYSGLALCPVDESVFWVYNEYACERGTVILGENGRWCTKLGCFRLRATATSVPTPRAGDFALGQNYPNPFNPLTSITFTLHSAQHVQLRIYDARGRLVTTLVDETRSPGESSVTWDGKNAGGNEVGSGVYYCKLTAGGLEQTRKMVLLK